MVFDCDQITFSAGMRLETQQEEEPCLFLILDLPTWSSQTTSHGALDPSLASGKNVVLQQSTGVLPSFPHYNCS